MVPNINGPKKIAQKRVAFAMVSHSIQTLFCDSMSLLYSLKYVIGCTFLILSIGPCKSDSNCAVGKTCQDGHCELGKLKFIAIIKYFSYLNYIRRAIKTYSKNYIALQDIMPYRRITFVVM